MRRLAKRRAAEVHAPDVALTFNPAAPGVLVKPAPKPKPERAGPKRRLRVRVRVRPGVAGVTALMVLVGGAVSLKKGGAPSDGIDSPKDAAKSVQMVGLDGGCGKPVEQSGAWKGHRSSSSRRDWPASGQVGAAWGATGFVIAREYVMTGGHVVSNTSHPTFNGLPAKVVLFGGPVDLAVLYVPGLDLPPLRFATDVDKGDTVTVAGLGGRPKLREAEVKGYLKASETTGGDGPDLQLEGDVKLDRALLPGDSGGPWLTDDGDVAAVSSWSYYDGPKKGFLDRLFGRYRDWAGVAVPADKAAEFAAKGIGLTKPVKVPGCPVVKEF